MIQMFTKRRVRLFVGSIFLALVLANAVIAMHARSMLHFSETGERTPDAEKLSLLTKLKLVFTGPTVPKPKARKNPEQYDLVVTKEKIQAFDGINLDVWDVEPRPTSTKSPGVILMLHGYGVEKSQLLPEAKVFKDLGFRPYLLDFRASGESDGFDTTIGFVEAQDVLSAYQHIQQKYPGTQIYIYGKSMGSAAALRAAGPLGLKPSAMILECPFDSLLNTVGNRMTLLGLPRAPFSEVLVFWGSVMYGFNGFLHNPADYAALVQSPTLLMVGKKDNRATPRDVQTVFNALLITKDLVVFPDAGHTNLYLLSSELWKTAVETFLTRVQAEQKTSSRP